MTIANKVCFGLGLAEKKTFLSAIDSLGGIQRANIHYITSSDPGFYGDPSTTTGFKRRRQFQIMSAKTPAKKSATPRATGTPSRPTTSTPSRRPLPTRLPNLDMSQAAQLANILKPLAPDDPKREKRILLERSNGDEVRANPSQLDYEEGAPYELVLRFDPPPRRSYIPTGEPCDKHLLEKFCVIICHNDHDTEDVKLIKWLAEALKESVAVENMEQRIKDILKNSSLIDYLKSFATKADVKEVLVRIENRFIKNEADIATNKAAIAKNTAGVAENKVGIDENKAGIANLTSHFGELRMETEALKRQVAEQKGRQTEEELREALLVHSLSEHLNTMLRTQRVSPEAARIIHRVCLALDALPKCPGQVYRGIDASTMEPGWIQAVSTKGYQYVDRAFSSTSLDANVAWKFGGEQPVMFIIEQFSGCNIQDYVAEMFEDEKEVCFKPGTKFVVTNSAWNQNKNPTTGEITNFLCIWMKEVA